MASIPAMLLLSASLLLRSALSVGGGEDSDPGAWPPLTTPFPTFHRFTNRTTSLGGDVFSEATGALAWPSVAAAAPAEFSVLASLVSAAEVRGLLDIVRAEALDVDADSVDARPTHEYYLERSGSPEGVRSIAGKADARADVFSARAPARAALAALARPIAAGRLTPYVNARYAAACGGACVVCHSLVRKYVDGERLVHPTHFDVRALVTAVVSLQSAGKDFEGGLYVSVGAGTEATVALQAGDAVVHQSNLLHGVRVTRGERWSWILWFKAVGDAAACDGDEGVEWNAEAARAGDPIAAFLHARRAASAGERLAWLRASAEGGFARAANELGMALLASNESEAMGLLRAAADAGEPEAMHNLALRLVRRGGGGGEAAAVALFRKAAAGGVAAAAANVGVAYYNGRGAARDLHAALRWFEYAGDPKSLLLAARIAESLELPSARSLVRRAAAAGSAEAARELREEAGGKGSGEL